LDESQEFGVLYEDTKVEPKIGSLSLISISRFDFTLKHVPDPKIGKIDLVEN